MIEAVIAELREAEYTYHLAIAKVGMVELQNLQNAFAKELRTLFRTLGKHISEGMTEALIKKMANSTNEIAIQEAKSELKVSFGTVDLEAVENTYKLVSKNIKGVKESEEKLEEIINYYAKKAYNLGGNTAHAFFGINPSFKLRDPEILKQIEERASNTTDGVMKGIIQKVQKTITKEYYENGKNPKAIAKIIQADFDNKISKTKSTLIAHQETLIPTMSARLTTFQKSGIMKKRWIAHNFVSPLDPRPSHKSANDQIVDIDKPFSVGYSKLQYPGDPMGAASETMRCHCVMLPVIPSEFEPSDAWKGGIGKEDSEEPQEETNVAPKKEPKAEEPKPPAFDKSKYEKGDWENWTFDDVARLKANSSEFDSDVLDKIDLKRIKTIQLTRTSMYEARDEVNFEVATQKLDTLNKLSTFGDMIAERNVSAVRRELAKDPKISIRKLIDMEIRTAEDFKEYFLQKYNLEIVSPTISRRQAKDLDTALNNKVIDKLRGLCPTPIKLDLSGGKSSPDFISSLVTKEDSSAIREKYLKLALRDTSRTLQSGDLLSKKIGLDVALSESKRNFQFKNSVMSDTLGKLMGIIAEEKEFISAYERIKALAWGNNIDNFVEFRESIGKLAELMGMKVPVEKQKKVKPKKRATSAEEEKTYADIFNDIVEGALKKSKEAFINIDGQAIEHQVVTIQNRDISIDLIDKGSTFNGYRVSFKIRDIGTEEFKKFMKDNRLQDHDYVLPDRNSKGVYNYPETNKYRDIEGSTWKSPEGNTIVRYCTDKGKWSLNNSVDIVIKADNYKDFVKTLRGVLDDVNLKDHVHIPEVVDEEALKMAKLNYIFKPSKAWEAKTNEDHRAIFKTLDPEERALLNTLVKKEISPGYFTYVDSSGHLRNYAESKGVNSLKHSLSEVSPEKLLLYINNGGLLATTERFKNGIKSEGMSSWTDISTGGAESVFTRINWGRRAAGTGCIRISTKILDRTDMYAYAGDTYGCTNPNSSSYGSDFKRRKSVKRVIDETISGDRGGNEFMFKKSIPVEYWEAFNAGYEKDEYVKYFKSNGMSKVNGIPVEKFFI